MSLKSEMHVARNGKKDMYIILEKLIKTKDYPTIEKEVQEFKNESHIKIVGLSSKEEKEDKVIRDKQTNNVINEISRRLNKEGKRIRATNRSYPYKYKLDDKPAKTITIHTTGDVFKKLDEATIKWTSTPTPKLGKVLSLNTELDGLINQHGLDLVAEYVLAKLQDRNKSDPKKALDKAITAKELFDKEKSKEGITKLKASVAKIARSTYFKTIPTE